MLFSDYLKQNGHSVLSLSKLTGIPYATLHSGLEHPGSLKADNLYKLSSQLNLPMGEIFTMLSSDRPVFPLAETLKKEQNEKRSLYAHTQTLLAFNCGIIDGFNTGVQTVSSIFETGKIEGSYNAADIVFASSCFSLFDILLSEASEQPSSGMIKKYFLLLNPKHKAYDTENINVYLSRFNCARSACFQDIIRLYAHTIKITGSCTLAQMLAFKECLRARITPFIINSDYKEYIIRGINKFNEDSTYLSDICLNMQESYSDIIKEYEGEDYLQKLA